MTNEQQRAQLRSTLKTPHEPQMQGAGQVPTTVLRKSPGRHLSAQEHSDLRHQLRQQRSVNDAGTLRRQN